MQRVWLASLVVLGALSSGRAAGAQTPPAGPSTAERAEARRHFQQGVAAYTRGEWAVALEEFQSAYRLAPHPSVRVNMAHCYAHLDRPVEAITHFEQFLAESPSAQTAQTAQVEARIAELRARVGEVQVTVTPADAAGLAVTLDGQAVSPGRPTRLLPGRHVVEAVGGGYAPARREVEVTAGRSQVLSLTLERSAPPAAPAPVVEPPAVAATVTPQPVAPAVVAPPDGVLIDPHADAPRRGPPPAAFYVVAGLTAAAAAGWITAGALALSTNADFDATVGEIQGASGDVAALQARGRDEAARASQLAMWSDVAMGVTVAGAVASIVLFMKTDFRPAVTVGATASSQGGRLSIGGRF